MNLIKIQWSSISSHDTKKAREQCEDNERTAAGVHEDLPVTITLIISRKFIKDQLPVGMTRTLYVFIGNNCLVRFYAGDKLGSMSGGRQRFTRSSTPSSNRCTNEDLSASTLALSL